MADATIQLKADISQLKSELTAAKRQVSVANSEFKAVAATMDDWSSNAEGLRAKLKQLDSTLKSQKAQLSILEDEYEKTKTLYGENSSAADKVKISINNMKASISKTESEMKKYDNELSDCENETGRFATETESATDATAKMSDGFTVAKGVLADLIASGIRAGISALKDFATSAVEAYQAFDEGQDIIVAKTGATGEALDALTENYVNVMHSVITESDNAGEAVGTVATKFDLEGEALENLTTKFIKFADLNETDVTSSINSVQSAAEAWDIEAENVGDLLDLLNTSSQKTGASVDSLASNLTTNAAALKDMNFNVDEAVTFLGNLETSGVDSSTVLAGLKKVLANASKEGKSTATALSELQDEMKNAKTDSEATVEAMELFGSKAGPAIAEACQNGRLNFKDLGEALTDYQGSVDETYEATQDGADKIKLAWQGIKTDVGAEVGSLLDDISPEIEELITFVEDEAKVILTTVKDNAPQIKDKIKDVIEFAKNGITWVIENFEGIKSTITTVGTILVATFAVNKLVAFVSMIQTMITTFAALKAATTAAETAQLLLNAAQLATPVGLVAAGVAALASGVIYLASKNKELKTATTSLTESEEEELEKVYELKDAYKELSDQRDDNVEKINVEYDHYEDLAEELESLADSSGVVKEADQDRANFIITTLNEALGTEIQMIDGVIQNYESEKAAIESLMETKRAEAILSANEELYTEALQNRDEALQTLVSTSGIYKQKVSDLTDAQDEYNKIAAEYAEVEGQGTVKAEELEAQLESAKTKVEENTAAMVQAKTAYINAGSAYDQYNTTIKNYEGLSSAIISGDTTKIKDALTDLTYNFKTAETSSKESLQQQVTDYQENLQALQQAIKDGTPGVTQDMVDQAVSMVAAAKAELNKFPSEAADSANSAAKSYYTTLGSEENISSVKSSAKTILDSANGVLDDNQGGIDAGENYILGYSSSILNSQQSVVDAVNTIGSKSTSTLNESIGANSPSRLTYASGEYFGDGFINGMNSKSNSIWTTAWNLAKTALNALKSGQQEGSPSKLTYKSGQNFTQGYINGATSLEQKLVNTVKGLASTAVKTAASVTISDFTSASQTVTESLASSLSKDTTYMMNKLTYQNNKKIAEFDKQISEYEKKRDAKKTSIQSKSDKKIAKWEKKKEASSSEAEKAALDKKIADEKKSATKLINANEKKYTKLIETQNKYKTAYQDASSEFLSEFSEAINSYSTEAQNLITSTISGIGDKYQTKYDDLISKQDNLVNKLKEAEDLFTVSGAGVMTISNIQEQTRQIQEYTQKLASIKEKVSSELFDQIASYDMKEGSAYIDQLLSMSTTDLEAYNKAYSEKLQAAEKAGQTIYSKDIQKVGDEYQKELDKAMGDLPAQLEELGKQTMEGFVNGLTKNTDYLDKNVKTFIKSMLTTFKKDLKIASPSKVTFKFGDYTGQGFVNGFKDTIGLVKKTAGQMASAAATPLEGLTANIGIARSAVNGSQVPGSSTVTNNYNLVQNNTSPKSLSALETYQARRQQIALIKAMT